ncbi:MAG TPA: SLC13 family permease, partial [Candidatus Binataceae bacterium]
MPDGHAIAIIIFLVTYTVLAVGKIPWFRIDRTGAAVAGGAAMVIFGVLSESEAAHSVDYHTLVLLFGMMIVVANLQLSGAFAIFARSMLKRARSGPGLLAMTIAASGVLAAFFINDVVCLALTPLFIQAARMLDEDPVPMLMGVATAANIGSTATITGNPQNMIVAGFAHLGYASFAAHLAPVSIVGLVIDYFVILVVYRSRLHRDDKRSAMRRVRPPRTNRPLLIKSSIVSAAAVLLFVLGYPTHLVAVGAGTALLFTRRIKPARIYKLIDWTMLAMFAGLFIVIAGFETTGFEHYVIERIGISHLGNPIVLSTAVAVLSNLVSNVPAVLLFRPLYPIMRVPHFAILIASASTLAGNLTVVGSI